MLKWLKLLVALFLVPVAVALGMALVRVLTACGAADVVWVPLLAGVACWFVIFFMLPKPMWVYVLGHELTHAIWTWLFGGTVKKMKVSSRGGHVIVDKNNFLIVLAPYFFPLYAVLVVLIWYILGDLVWDWRPWIVWFHLALGAAYAFHVTLTWHILRQEQSDITSQGWVFSAVIIFLGNAVLLLAGVPLITEKLPIWRPFVWWWADTGLIFQFLWQNGRWAVEKMLAIHS